MVSPGVRDPQWSAHLSHPTGGATRGVGRPSWLLLCCVSAFALVLRRLVLIYRVTYNFGGTSERSEGLPFENIIFLGIFFGNFFNLMALGAHSFFATRVFFDSRTRTRHAQSVHPSVRPQVARAETGTMSVWSTALAGPRTCVPPVPTSSLLRSRACRTHRHRCLPRASAASGAAADGAASDNAKLLKKKADGIVELLKGVSVTFVGDNEAANAAAARAMAKALRYTPLSTPELVEKITGSTRDAIVAAEGEAGLVIAETAVFEELSTFIRCCVGTSGGGRGATARGACWDYLFGQFTVWLDDVPAAGRAAAAAEAAVATGRGGGGEGSESIMPQREAYEFADVHLVMSSAEVGTEAEAAGIAIQALGAIQRMMEADPQLSGKKGFYIKMGCRGDWPVLQPPGWDGTKAGMVNPATGKPYSDAPMPQPAE